MVIHWSWSGSNNTTEFVEGGGGWLSSRLYVASKFTPRACAKFLTLPKQ